MTHPVTSEHPETSKPPIDFAAIKIRQQATWAAGDYAMVGVTLQIVAESLCVAADLRPGQRVLDVATGSGNTALAAARCFTDVVGVDYVPALLARGRERAKVERLPIEFREGDAEALPFPDASFDAVLSTFGVMFAPDQQRAANELVRVCRSGGRIALASWTPEGVLGESFRVIAGHVPPPAGLQPAVAWGSESHLRRLFGANAREFRFARRNFVFRYRSFEHWLEIFRSYYGPLHKAFLALDVGSQRQLAKELREMLERWNTSGDSTLVYPGEYLEAIVVRA